MAKLFEKTWIKGLELKNRSVRSATWSGVGDDHGFVVDTALELYGNLAAGGVGLIVTGFQYVTSNGVALPYQLGAYSDDHTEGLTRLAESIHAQGGKVAAQLVHTGSKANPDLFHAGEEIQAPSSINDPVTGRTPKAMSARDIATAVEAYAAAALRCKTAGFDGVQLHGAHGYGINQFLSSASNARGDGYGGNVGKRYRFLGETMEAVKGSVGEGYPVMIKLSGHDYYEGGLTTEESLNIARRLCDDGIDCIEISAGSRASYDGMIPSRLKIQKREHEAYLAELAEMFKQSLTVPVITVGGIRSPSVIADILSLGKADYTAMCRPFIREPHLIRRWESGDLTKAACVSCNGCFETALEGNGVCCKIDKKNREKEGRTEA